MNLRSALLFILICFTVNVFSQDAFHVLHLEASDLPKEITVNGTVKNAVRWSDNSGDNIIVTTETGAYASTDSTEDKNAAVYAYHFIVGKDSVKQLWILTDLVRECMSVIKAEYLNATFHITDLNNNGTAEVWLMYITDCAVENNPADLKLIMYEGKQKFAMRGQTKVRVSDTEFEGGDYSFSKSFIEAPLEFTEFAKEMWTRNYIRE